MGEVAEKTGWWADRLVWLMRFLAIAGLGICLFLIWSAMQVGPIAGCSGDGFFNCDHVLHSRWSKILGFSVSIPAAAIYGTLCVALWLVGRGVAAPVRAAAWFVATVAIFAAATSAIWFISLQLLAIGHLCKYCLIAHTISLTLAGLLLVFRPMPSVAWAKPVLIGVGGTLLLVVGQLFGPTAKTYELESYESDEAVSADYETLDFDMDMDFDEDFEMMDQVVDSSALAEPVAVEPAEPWDDASVEVPVETTTPNPDADSPDYGISDPSASENTALDTANSDTMTSDDGARDIVTANIPASEAETSDTEPRDPEAFDVKSSTSSTVDVTHAVNTIPASTNTTTTARPDTTPQKMPSPSLTPLPPPGDSPEASRSTSPESNKRYVMYPGVRAKLNVHQWPMIGSPDAEHVLVELFDYTCGHCRQMSRYLDVARSRFGSQVAVMVLPVPLDGDCNRTVQTTSASSQHACEIARMALAIWRLKPEAFEEYHRWLLASSKPRTVWEARAKAATLVDPLALDRQIQSKVVSAFLAKHVSIYERAGQGALPKLFTDRITVRGNVNSADELCSLLQQNHGLASAR